jgi:hypothetical protein
VAIIIIGILIIMQILLFFLLLPISGLILTMSAIASVAVVTAVTIVAAVEASGGCFTGDTRISTKTGPRAIRELRVGDILADGGLITAVHRFKTPDMLFRLGDSIVSGEHLVVEENGQKIPVKHHPRAAAVKNCSRINELWCLTTTTRRIPTPDGTLYADWEEIDEHDVESLTDWYEAVWHRLNGSPPSVKIPAPILQSEAGLSPTCTVRSIMYYFGVPYRTGSVMLDQIEIGDMIEDGPGWTQVIGIVKIDGPEVAQSVILDGQQMSSATWIQEGSPSLWKPAGFTRDATKQLHPMRWIHLYTESGTFSLTSGLQVRDASDVGLPALSSLVEAIVL